MAKSKDKRLQIVLDMPAGLRRKQPGEEYAPEKDEVLAWMKDQPGIMNFMFEKLKFWGYIVYDPETGAWGGAGHGA